MSYDLNVYWQEALSSDSLRELFAAVGLGVDDAEGDAGSLTVVRGAKGKYCFTLGLPVAVELEDVPEDVTSVLLAPAFLDELLVEGSSPIGGPFTRHAGGVNAVAIGQLDGRTIIVGGGYGTVRVWDAATGAPIGVPFTGHTDGFRWPRGSWTGAPSSCPGATTGRCGCG